MLDLISGHGGPPDGTARNNEIRGRWPSRSRIDDDDDVRQTRYWVVAVSKVFWSGPIPVIWRGKPLKCRWPGEVTGAAGVSAGMGAFGRDSHRRACCSGTRRGRRRPGPIGA